MVGSVGEGRGDKGRKDEGTGEECWGVWGRRGEGRKCRDVPNRYYPFQSSGPSFSCVSQNLKCAFFEIEHTFSFGVFGSCIPCTRTTCHHNVGGYMKRENQIDSQKLKVNHINAQS